ncbi:hypothetical protein ACO22_04702 [Paracoccidioides brasiliensis]|uniref:Uncharacterized protein n=1 Tax=Paracoccidioides brasiliensis TaxID=121759 RepID=A0A1D2JCC2_PARBR|nr:hypothetical protein ACO22_04702 [Paracoccidioides brasiliensis]
MDPPFDSPDGKTPQKPTWKKKLCEIVNRRRSSERQFSRTTCSWCKSAAGILPWKSRPIEAANRSASATQPLGKSLIAGKPRSLKLGCSKL